MQDQDVVGKVVEINIECANGLGSLAAGDVLSKDIMIGDHEWTVLCCPRGPAAPGAGDDFFSVQFVNRTNASNALVQFLVIVLGRPAPGGAPVAAPPTVFCSWTQGFKEYPSQGQEPRTFSSFAVGTAGSSARCYVRTSDLVEMCAVCGVITVTCGVTVLRHNLTPVPQSTYQTDIQDLRQKNLFGEPDVKFVFGGEGNDDGKTFTLHRRVLSARSPVLKAQLEGSMAESSAAVIRPGDQISISTFVALVVYMYYDRLPKASECGGLSVELFRQLLAAADWYGIDRLKMMCAKKLWDDYLSVFTVCKTLWYARTYNCQKLRKACEEYIAAPQNNEFAFTDEFLWLRLNAPDIWDEIHPRVLANRRKTD